MGCKQPFRVQKAEGECVQRRAKGLTLIDCGVGVSDRFEDRHVEVSIFKTHYFQYSEREEL